MQIPSTLRECVDRNCTTKNFVAKQFYLFLICGQFSFHSVSIVHFGLHFGILFLEDFMFFRQISEPRLVVIGWNSFNCNFGSYRGCCFCAYIEQRKKLGKSVHSSTITFTILLTVVDAVDALFVAGTTGRLNDVDDVPLVFVFDAIPFVAGFVTVMPLAAALDGALIFASLDGIDSIVAAAPRFNGTNFAWVKSLIERLRRNVWRSSTTILRSRGSGDVALVRVD